MRSPLLQLSSWSVSDCCKICMSCRKICHKCEKCPVLLRPVVFCSRYLFLFQVCLFFCTAHSCAYDQNHSCGGLHLLSMNVDSQKGVFSWYSSNKHLQIVHCAEDNYVSTLSLHGVYGYSRKTQLQLLVHTAHYTGSKDTETGEEKNTHKNGNWG